MENITPPKKMGRPKVVGLPEMKMVAFAIPKQQAIFLKRKAEDEGISLSALIRKYLPTC